MEITDLPAVNATLNATSAVLLLFAYAAIRRHEVERHRKLMLATAATSSLFLVSYLVYHAQVGSVRFTGTGPVRTVYFAILLTHTVLAALIVLLPVPGTNVLPALALVVLTVGVARRDGVLFLCGVAIGLAGVLVALVAAGLAVELVRFLWDRIVG